VIHLAAKDLHEEGYVIDPVVEVKAYRGRLYDLSDHLGTLAEARVRSQYTFGTPGLYAIDTATRVEIKDERGSVRDLFTKYAVKDGGAAILWRAFRMTPETPYLYVHFEEAVRLAEPDSR